MQNVSMSAIAKRTRKGGGGFEEFVRTLKEIVELSKRSGKIIKALRATASEDIDLEKARAIFSVHDTIANNEWREFEKDLISSAFDRYVKELEHRSPKHTPEDIRKFAEFVELYHRYRDHPWARMALRTAGTTISTPEHIDQLKRIAAKISSLEKEEHKTLAWMALYHTSKQGIGTPSDVHERLIELESSIHEPKRLEGLMKKRYRIFHER